MVLPGHHVRAVSILVDADAAHAHDQALVSTSVSQVFLLLIHLFSSLAQYFRIQDIPYGLKAFLYMTILIR